MGYEEAKNKGRYLINEQIRMRDEIEFKKILDAPKGQRSRMFRDYVKRGERESTNRNREKIVYLKEEMDEALKSLFCTGESVEEGMEIRRRDTGIRTGQEEISRVIKNMKSNSAAGLDGVTMDAIIKLGSPYIQYLETVFNHIFSGGGIPDSWHEGKVALLPKDGVDNNILKNRRPLTITPIAYRIFMQILKERASRGKCLEEWQCGFRSVYKIDDNSYILTQIIVISKMVGVYGNIFRFRKAYDKVERELLYVY